MSNPSNGDNLRAIMHLFDRSANSTRNTGLDDMLNNVDQGIDINASVPSDSVIASVNQPIHTGSRDTGITTCADAMVDDIDYRRCGKTNFIDTPGYYRTGPKIYEIPGLTTPTQTNLTDTFNEGVSESVGDDRVSNRDDSSVEEGEGRLIDDDDEISDHNNIITDSEGENDDENDYISSNGSLEPNQGDDENVVGRKRNVTHPTRDSHQHSRGEHNKKRKTTGSDGNLLRKDVDSLHTSTHNNSTDTRADANDDHLDDCTITTSQNSIGGDDDDDNYGGTSHISRSALIRDIDVDEIIDRLSPEEQAFVMDRVVQRIYKKASKCLNGADELCIRCMYSSENVTADPYEKDAIDCTIDNGIDDDVSLDMSNADADTSERESSINDTTSSTEDLPTLWKMMDNIWRREHDKLMKQPKCVIMIMCAFYNVRICRRLEGEPSFTAAMMMRHYTRHSASGITTLVMNFRDCVDLIHRMRGDGNGTGQVVVEHTILKTQQVSPGGLNMFLKIQKRMMDLQKAITLYWKMHEAP